MTSTAAPSTPTSQTHLGLLSGVRLLTNGAFRFLYPFLPVVARDLDVDAADAGLLVAALSFGGMISPALRGRLTGGHEQSRNLAVLSALITGVAVVGVALSPVAFVAMGLLIVVGASKPLVDVASISYVSDRTDFRRRARATSVMELTWAGSLVVVAPMAGVMAGWWSWRVPFALLGLLVAASSVALRRRLDVDEVPTERRAARPARWTRIEIQMLVTVALLYAMLEATFSVFGLWLDADHGVSVEELGGLAAATAMGEMLGASLVLWLGDHLGKHRSALLGLATCIVGLALLPAAPSLPLAIGALALALAGSEIAIVSTIPLASEVQPSTRTRFLAAMSAAGSFSRAGIAIVAAMAFAAVGLRANVAMSITAAVLTGTLLTITVRQEPRLQEPRRTR